MEFYEVLHNDCYGGFHFPTEFLEKVFQTYPPHSDVGKSLWRKENITKFISPDEESEEKSKPPTPIPEFVASALLQQAIQKEECCPISMEDLTTENATVTSCYHIFNHESLQNWLETNTSCPVCKQSCVVTRVLPTIPIQS